MHSSKQLLKLALFTTGGTIDGSDSDRGVKKGFSSAEQWLIAQPQLDVRACQLFNKDSREINASDRDHIFEAVRKCKNEKIIITHGTFTMPETGAAIKRQLGETNKTVLLVGAWIPFGEKNSDAPEQLRFAIEILSRGTKGVHICMDGRLWDPIQTVKVELSDGKFEWQDKNA